MKQKQVQKHDVVQHRRYEVLPVFDIALFNSSTMSDKALQLEIIKLFATQLISVRQSLDCAPMNLEEAKFLGHTLRGAALAIGADEIAALALEWDELAFDQSEFTRLLAEAEVRFNAAAATFFQNS